MVQSWHRFVREEDKGTTLGEAGPKPNSKQTAEESLPLAIYALSIWGVPTHVPHARPLMLAVKGWRRYGSAIS